jgi:hypothetical protein
MTFVLTLGELAYVQESMLVLKEYSTVLLGCDAGESGRRLTT